MELQSEALLKEQMGEVGAELAEKLAAKVIDTIDGFPSTDVQRGAILRGIAEALVAASAKRRSQA
jgi:hypothetical protein